jgi:cell division septal protein FtsQ
MWLDDREISLRTLGDRRENRRRQQILNVSSRVSGSSTRGIKIAVILLVLLAAGTVSLLAWLSWRGLFSKNPRFAIKTIAVEGCRNIRPDILRDWMRVTEGANTFEYSIGDVRKSILKNAHAIKNVEISRVLPDAMRVVVSERMALAHIARDQGFVVDRDGVVFSQSTTGLDLPQITGCRDRLRPGFQIKGNGLAALEMLEVSRFNLKDDIDIVSVAVQHDDFLVLTLRDSRRIKFSWKGMKKHDESSRQNLSARMADLAVKLKSEKVMRLMELDATFEDGRIIGSSVGESRN